MLKKICRWILKKEIKKLKDEKEEYRNTMVDRNIELHFTRRKLQVSEQNVIDLVKKIKKVDIVEDAYYRLFNFFEEISKRYNLDISIPSKENEDNLKNEDDFLYLSSKNLDVPSPEFIINQTLEIIDENPGIHYHSGNTQNSLILMTDIEFKDYSKRLLVKHRLDQDMILSSKFYGLPTEAFNTMVNDLKSKLNEVLLFINYNERMKKRVDE